MWSHRIFFVCASTAGCSPFGTVLAGALTRYSFDSKTPLFVGVPQHVIDPSAPLK